MVPTSSGTAALIAKQVWQFFRIEIPSLLQFDALYDYDPIVIIVVVYIFLFAC